MNINEFHLLSKRYLAGETSKEEEEQLMKWLKDQQSPISSELSEEIGERMWHKIEEKLPSRAIKWQYWLTGVAAMILLGFIWMKIPVGTTDKSIELVKQTGIQVKNTTHLDQEIELKDGTIVKLKDGATLVYGKNFNEEKREVFLFGEAFFNVKRNVNKPFLVHTGDLVTEVLGTSFRIVSTEKSSNIEVSVASGKVSVYNKDVNKKNERNGVIITRNQKVSYDLISKKITTSLVDNPTPNQESKKTNSIFIFQSTPLQTVLDLFHEQYGIEFILNNPVAQNCQITADLNGLPLSNQLDLICRSIDANYEKRGTVIFIQGGSCN
ncbi:FecR family protein [Aquirufa nivalisilvae]|uniref:FecR family protein n=1 Tax=Aquirufa TaxID=2676247 RepID=UPI001CAA73B1|nr:MULTISPECIES: FecR family protein [Aquirufa]MBZ1326872.1 FecR family protein [Aquirufa aurantiipilula]MCZ2479596.1 FecR family protein [Aquirufa nivalisilvae]MCZ2481586.1 FecR family protein [Aquirufa nivalisilvae]